GATAPRRSALGASLSGQVRHAGETEVTPACIGKNRLVADGDAVLRWAETTANLDVLAACPPHLPPPDTGPDLALDPQCRGRSQLRLHVGELPSPRPPIPIPLN